MNNLYNQDAARAKLDAIYEERKKFENPNVPQLTDVKVEDVRFEAVEYPPSMRIMVKDEVGEHAEVVMKVQGVICASTLPPFRRPPSTKSISSIRNLRQFVKLTALGSQLFQDAYEQIENIQKRLQVQLGGELVQAINFVPYEGNACIEAHARYFTDRNLVPFEKSQAFNVHVDPFKVLANLRPDVFIHGPNNKVDYVERTTDRNGCVRHVPIDPSILRAGDIVEIAFSCVAVPTKEGKRMMYLNLRALTLLDDSVRKEAEQKMHLTTPPATPPKITSFKRTQAYLDLDYDDDEGGKRKKGRKEHDSADEHHPALEGNGDN